jgi:hypothetical protein
MHTKNATVIFTHLQGDDDWSFWVFGWIKGWWEELMEVDTILFFKLKLTIEWVFNPS